MMIRLKETDLRARFKEYADQALIRKVQHPTTGEWTEERGYIIDPENQAAIDKAFETFEQGKLGVWIAGNSGSGKTLFFEILQRIIHPKDENAFLKFHMSDVVINFKSKGADIFHEYQTKNVMFDDVYSENLGHHFADQKVEVFQTFIYLRYDQWRKYGVKTHITTNNDRTEFMNRYGSKCVFRLDEMTENIILGGTTDYTNRRTYKNFQSLPTVYHPTIKTEEQIEWEKIYQQHRENVKNNPQPQRETTLGAKLREALAGLKDKPTTDNT